MLRDDPTGEIEAALQGSLAPGHYEIAVGSGRSFDRVAVVVPAGVSATEAASSLAKLPVPLATENADDIWDRLALGMRRAAELRTQSQLIAAALAWRGRGRILGPLNPDLLIRFGVSNWR